MPDTPVLFLLVAYGNADDVVGFVRTMSDLDPALSFAVCDNTEDQSESSRERLRGALSGYSAEVVFRPDNPGYLDGALAALSGWRQAHPDDRPHWVILSNTDLTVEGELFSVVLGDHPHDEPRVLAPRLTEGAARVEKNPYQLAPRSLLRHRLNAWVSVTRWTAYGYVGLSSVRRSLHRRRLGRAPVPTSAPAPSGTTMYAVYGALIVFSRGFLDRVDLPAGVPLQAEEFAIAEAARRAQVPVTFEPRLHMHHDAHTTTGPYLTLRRAGQVSVAFRYIARTAAS